MSRLEIVICRVDDESQPERRTELDRIEVPRQDACCLQKETALDELEGETLATGHEVMRRLLLRQWEGVEEQLVAGYQDLFPPQLSQAGRPRPAEGGQPVGGPEPSPPGPGAPRRRARAARQRPAP
jgi:hypothetical protein